MKKFKVKFKILDDKLTAEQIIEYINEVFEGTEITKLTVIGDE